MLLTLNSLEYTEEHQASKYSELMSNIPFVRMLNNSLKEVDKINQSNLWLGDEITSSIKAWFKVSDEAGLSAA